MFRCPVFSERVALVQLLQPPTQPSSTDISKWNSAGQGETGASTPDQRAIVAALAAAVQAMVAVTAQRQEEEEGAISHTSAQQTVVTGKAITARAEAIGAKTKARTRVWLGHLRLG